MRYFCAPNFLISVALLFESTFASTSKFQVALLFITTLRCSYTFQKGGYQYRLCPSSEYLTEDCMKKLPLQFVGRTYLEYRNGSRELIPSIFAYSNGTGVFDGAPPGPGAWARNPIPVSQRRRRRKRKSAPSSWQILTIPASPTLLHTQTHTNT